MWKLYATLLLLTFCLTTAAQNEVGDVTAKSYDLPVHAVSGRCYTKCYTPNQYITMPKAILMTEAHKTVEKIAPVYDSVEVKIIEKESFTIYALTPPVYHVVEEEVMVRDSFERVYQELPVIDTIQEVVLVAPASSKWVKARVEANCLSANLYDCTVWCLESIPAIYETINNTVVKTPGLTRIEKDPPKYLEMSYAILDMPATAFPRVVPEKYRSFKKQVLKEPGTTKLIDLPATYDTIQVQQLVKNGFFTDWVEVLCDVDYEGYTPNQNNLPYNIYDDHELDLALAHWANKATLAVDQVYLPQLNCEILPLVKKMVTANKIACVLPTEGYQVSDETTKEPINIKMFRRAKRLYENAAQVEKKYSLSSYLSFPY